MEAYAAPVIGEHVLGTILVVEDEYVIAQDVASQLERAGARVLGPVGRLGAALALLAQEPHVSGAILDVKLHDELVYTLAEALERRGIPYIFATAYGREELSPRFRHARYLGKPFTIRNVIATLRSAKAEALCVAPDKFEAS